MNVNLEELSGIKRQLTVELPAETVAGLKEKHLADLTRKAAVKGFRPGKVPKSLVARVYGDQLKGLVIEEMITDNMPKILEDHQLDPVGQPVIESVAYEDGQPFKFVLSLEVRPVFATPEWRGLELTQEKYEITDKDVDQELETLRDRLATLTTVTDESWTLKEGDVAVIDYQGFDGETPIAALKVEGATLEMGAGQLQSDFEANLLGLKKGENREFPFTLPKGAASKKWAGQSVTMKAALREIKVREKPALDDEFVKDLDIEGVETLDGLRSRIRDDLATSRADRIEKGFERQILDKLAALVDIEVPSALTEREAAAMVESTRINFRRQGLDFDKFGLNLQTMRENLKPKAEVKVKAALVLHQIAGDLKMEATEADVEAELEKLALQYDQSVELLRNFHESQGLLDTLKERLQADKTLKAVKEQARIVEVEPPVPGEEPEPAAEPSVQP